MIVLPNECNQKIGSAVFTPLSSVVGTIQGPFDEDEGDEVAKEKQEEDELGEKLQKDETIVSSAYMVP